MNTVFVPAFSATLIAVAKVFLVMAAAAALVRARVLTNAHISALTAVTVNVLLPCLIFSNIVGTFDPGSFPFWWALPLAAVVMILLGMGLGALIYRKQLPAKRSLLALCGMHNAGYLILPIGRALFPLEFDLFATYTFLYLLGAGPLLWSIGKSLVTSDRGKRVEWKGLATPPLIANVAAILLVLSGWHAHIPGLLLDPLDMLGRAAVPVANLILGAVLGGISLRLKPYLWDAMGTILVKLVMLPAATILVLQAMGVREAYPLLAAFLVLESAAAPATGLILQVRHYGGDEERISSLMMLSYLACLLLMPLWIAVWNSL